MPRITQKNTTYIPPAANPPSKDKSKEISTETEENSTREQITLWPHRLAPEAPGSEDSPELKISSNKPVSDDKSNLAIALENQNKLLAVAFEETTLGKKSRILSENNLFFDLLHEPTLSAPELVRRHAGLLVGHRRSCKGTNEVAGWISNTLKRTISLNFPQIKNDSEKKLMISKFESLARRLDNLTAYRLACRHINLNDSAVPKYFS